MKILLVDDHVLFRDGMRYVLCKLGDHVQILDAGNFPDAIAAGLSNKDIGLTIGLAEGTVKIHVAAIFQALRVNKRMDAVQAARRTGLLAEKNSVS